MAFQAKKFAMIDKSHCVACGCCVPICPLSAIEIYRGCFALVDTVKCVGCGKCSAACPASVIKIEVRE